jgi:hypothetical protein
VGQDRTVPTTSPAVRSSLLAATLLVLASCDAAAPEAGPTAAPATAPSAGAPAPSSAAPGCPGARISVGPVVKHDVLTEVATAVTITSPSGGRLDAPLRPVRRYTAEVLARGEVPEHAVYRAFAEKVGGATPLPPLGETAPADDGGPTTIDGPGRLVEYAGVKAVRATFDYACGGVTARGAVSSWLTEISGILECTGRVRAPRSPMHDEARALGCGG